MTEWRAIPEFPDYFVSDDGRIKSFRRNADGRIGKTPTNSRGYQQIGLSRDGQRFQRTVHSLVALAFHGPRPAGLGDIRHLNGDKADNRPANLAYGTRGENQADSIKHGTHHESRKTHCKRDHEFTPENTNVWRRSRICRTCKAEYDRERFARSRAS